MTPQIKITGKGMPTEEEVINFLKRSENEKKTKKTI